MAELLVSADWLYDHLNDPGVVIVDCRFALRQPEQGQEDYQKAHIPGAYYLDLNRDLSSPIEKHGGRHPLPAIAPFVRTLEQMGIQSESPQGQTLVVAYDDSRLAFAARLWWLLRYLGHDRVVLLDGGFSAWTAAGYPTTDERPPAKPGRFTPRIRTKQVVNIEQVKARKDVAGVVLVDSREEERYRGEQEPIDPIAGHIPGAVNYPWKTVTDAAGFVRSPEAQKDRWRSLASAEEVIVYCGSGVTACVNLVSLELAGMPTGKLYVGSWSDWCSYLLAESESANP